MENKKFVKCTSCHKQYSVHMYTNNSHYMCKQCRSLKKDNIRIQNNKKLQSGYCQFCGNPHDYTYASGRFCSYSCARKFSSVRQKGQIKTMQCINCKKIFTQYIGTKTHNYICRTCKKIYKQYTKNCQICGRLQNLDHTICKYVAYKKDILITYFNFKKQ